MGRVRRRQFLITAGALLATPLAAFGQGSARKLGVLSLDPPPSAQASANSAFRAKLRQLGWVEGQNLAISGAYADLKQERLSALAGDLVRERVDAIYAVGGEAAVAAARATTSIPIVFWAVAWPVEQGLIDSFAKPGRNVTGVSTYTGLEVSAKRLEFLREITPAAKRISWILAPTTAETVQGGAYDVKPYLESEAKKLGFEIRWHRVASSSDLENAFSEILAYRAQALAVAASAVTFAARERIADFALRNRLPSGSVFPQFAEAGGLLAYGAAGLLSATIEKSAEYVDRILRGALPTDLPVERPSRYELVINRKTAGALGLKIPQSLLLRADRVIE